MNTRVVTDTSLHRSAFWLLGATVRDDRRRIVELAEAKLLELDHDLCQKARSELTNPRTRLAAEVAWLPGVSPRKATELAGNVITDPMSVRAETGLPTLAHANLMAAAFETTRLGDEPDMLVEFVEELARLADDLSVDEVLRDINEDRAVSGFPEIRSRDQVESELAKRKRYYRNAIKGALNRLPPTLLVEAMTGIVDSVTAGGECHGPELIDELVDSYEIDAQEFLHKEAENIHKLIVAVRRSAASGEEAVEPLVDALAVVVRNWDRTAQPIQLSAKARGIGHQPSSELAYSIRNLAIDLFNEHDMITQAKRLTVLLQEIFAELPEVSERVEQDVDKLEDIFRNRKEAESKRNEWARQITYSAEIGAVFKTTLSISPEGLEWRDKRYPLEAITRVRWGGVRHSVNGIPTGTTYTMAFGDDQSEAVVETRRKEIYSTFIEKLYQAVGIRLMIDLLDNLRAGNVVAFGDARVKDDGVWLVRHKFWSTEPVWCPWYRTHVWSADGAFIIRADDDKKTYVSLSYIDEPNVHLLEQVIRMAFKKRGLRRLSEVLS